MSAISKPLVNFSGSLTPTVVINADNVSTIEKTDIPVSPSGVKARYGITVTFVMPNPVKKQDIWFATSGARNTSFTSLQTLLCATVA